MYQSLVVAEAPAVEPVSLAEVQHHCRIDVHDDDLYTKGLITVARTLVEAHLARALITQQLVWSVADAPIMGSPAPGLVGPLQVLPLAFSWLTLARRPLELPRSPAISVDLVQRVATDGTVTAAAAGDYNVLLGSDPARMRLNTLGPSGGGLIVTFTVGYGTDGRFVPQPIRHAVMMLTAWLFENRGDDGGEWPAVVERLLQPYRVMTFGG